MHADCGAQSNAATDGIDGAGVHVITFRTEHVPLRWLNTVVALGEGSVDRQREALKMRYWSWHVEHRPGLGG